MYHVERGHSATRDATRPPVVGCKVAFCLDGLGIGLPSNAIIGFDGSGIVFALDLK